MAGGSIQAQKLTADKVISNNQFTCLEADKKLKNRYLKAVFEFSITKFGYSNVR